MASAGLPDGHQALPAAQAVKGPPGRLSRKPPGVALDGENGQVGLEKDGKPTTPSGRKGFDSGGISNI